MPRKSLRELETERRARLGLDPLPPPLPPRKKRIRKDFPRAAPEPPKESLPAKESLAPKNLAPPPLKTLAPKEPLPAKDSLAAKGYLRLPHDITDRVLPTLTPSAQAALVHLYRLSHGFGKATCKISVEGLARRLNTSAPTARTAARTLEARGLIRALGVDNTSQVRGVIYEVLVGGTGKDSLPAKDSLAGQKSLPIKEERIKEKEIEMTPEDLELFREAGGKFEGEA